MFLVSGSQTNFTTCSTSIPSTLRSIIRRNQGGPKFLERIRQPIRLILGLEGAGMLCLPTQLCIFTTKDRDLPSSVYLEWYYLKSRSHTFLYLHI